MNKQKRDLQSNVRVDMQAPEGVLIYNEPDGTLKITRIWDKTIGKVLLVVLVILVAIVSFAIFNNLASLKTLYGKFFFSMPILIVMWLFYVIVASFINSTSITVTDFKIKIKHTPLWWYGKKEFECHEIKKIYYSIDGKDSGSQNLFKIVVVLKDKKQVKLLSMMLYTETAQFIAQKIGEHLKLLVY